MFLLFDIEGTTTPITFVHDVLFPYSREHLPDYVRRNADQSQVAECLADVSKTAKLEGLEANDLEELITLLKTWIAEDRKHPALKNLQGQIWKFGYEEGAYTSELYDDVLPQLRQWRRDGHVLGIYSSGSVAAQKLLFQYTNYGDVTPLLSHYFDTTIGHKRESQSYRNLLTSLNCDGDQVVFFSDVAEELDAAKEVGIHPVHIIRPGTKPSGDHPQAADFYAARLPS